MDLYKRSVFFEGLVKCLKRLRIGWLIVEVKWYFRYECILENRIRKKLNFENLYWFVIVVMLCLEVLWMLLVNVFYSILSIRLVRILMRLLEII